MTDNIRRVNVRLSEKQFELLEKQAKEMGMSKTGYVSHLIAMVEQNKKSQEMFKQAFRQVENVTKNMSPEMQVQLMQDGMKGLLDE